MQIEVCGKDRAADLGAAIEQEAQALERDGRFPQTPATGHSALFLRTAGDEPAYLRILLSLLIAKCGASVADFDVPRRPGRIGALGGRLRRALWKLLRYQHERVVSQQNLIHAHMTAAMEMMHQQHTAELAALRERIDALEAGAGTARGTAPAPTGARDHAD